jgi:hypothetical protein
MKKRHSLFIILWIVGASVYAKKVLTITNKTMKLPLQKL